MKIEGIPPAGSGGDATGKKSEKVSGKPFDAFLKESVDTAKTENAGKITLPGPLAPLAGVMETSGAFSAEAVGQMEKTLDDLEFYRNTLSNEDVPEERLLPMADELMKKKESLVSMLSHVDDPALQGLITETATLIINENSRYHSP